jgi:uncharacterized protein (TIGR00156 family)
VGGYTGPGPALVSVQQALSMPDGTWISIKGNITEYLGGKKYKITDPTGAADAKIGTKAWAGQHVSASDAVVLHGRSLLNAHERRAGAGIAARRVDGAGAGAVSGSRRRV